MINIKKALVDGSHMVKRLKSEGYWVRGVDIKYPEFSKTAADDFIQGDLRDADFVDLCLDRHFDEIYQFAADMGGSYLFTGENDANIMHNSIQMGLNILKRYQLILQKFSILHWFIQN